MHSIDSAGKNQQNKLLAFPLAAKRGLSAPLDLDRLHDQVDVLRRPVPVESVGAPRLQEMDGLAHDARNVMTSLTLLAGLMAEPGMLKEGDKHLAAELASLTGSLASLVERMAEAPVGPRPSVGAEPVFRREPLRAGLAGRRLRGSLEAGTLEAGPMVKGCERLLASIAGPSVAVNISFERGLGVLKLEEDDLVRVLMNLVKNAGEAMPKGGRVVITVRKGLGAEPNALITVQDTGAGIPAHVMGQIFQAGFSSKTGGKRWPATQNYGLGLTIVRELVEAVGGGVRVRSELRKGTTFELKVPCLKG